MTAGGGGQVSSSKPTHSTQRRYWRGQSMPGWSAKRSLALLGAGAALLFFLSPLLGENGLPSFFKLRHERDQLRAEVGHLKSQEQILDRKVTDLQHDATTLEFFVREKYGMHLPGEEIVEIVDKRTLAESP